MEDRRSEVTTFVVVGVIVAVVEVPIARAVVIGPEADLLSRGVSMFLGHRHEAARLRVHVSDNRRMRLLFLKQFDVKAILGQLHLLHRFHLPVIGNWLNALKNV